MKLFKKKKKEPSDGIKYADFQRRNFAVVIDLALVLVFIMVLSPETEYPDQIKNIITQQEMGMISDGEASAKVSHFLLQEGGLAHIIALLLTNTVIAGIVVISFWVYRSATPGKMLLGMRIVDSKTLEKPNIFRYIVRYYIGYVISVLFFGLGFLWVGFNKRRRGWHDYISGTVVIVDPENDAAEHMRIWVKKFIVKQYGRIKSKFKNKTDNKK